MKHYQLSIALFAMAMITPQMTIAAEPGAQAGTETAATLNGDSPIEAIAASQAGKAALEARMPGVLAHAAYEQFKSMSLRALAPMSGGIITDEKISALEADLKAAK